MTRKRILIAAAGVLVLAAAATIGTQFYRIQRSMVAWRVRHNLPIRVGGIKFHVPPGLEFYESRRETQGRWQFIRRNQFKEGEAFYVIETNAHTAPKLKSSVSSVGSRRFVKTLPLTLAGKDGLCAEFEERMELSSAFEPPFICIDCYFGPRLGVVYLGRAKGVNEFYRFIQDAE